MSWPYSTYGIPDDQFIRDEEIPMTKEEIRVLALSKLRIARGFTLVDVGSGTGSVTVEMALAVGSMGKVIAIDNNPKAVELTKRNAERFGVLDRVDVRFGDASEVLRNLEVRIDGAFIGGASNEIEEAIRILDQRLRKGARIVTDAIQIETAYKAIKALELLRYDVDVTMVTISKGRKTSTGYALLARNPIFIITGEKR
ncbi:MAG: precorrin-6Y C5,15-methyltransferase (decarboxylating) subunit CbiT [Sulfolobales archaeon]|nr:precorrin-6Y C5,15-methyltransferase (decarboxylating) subunit CbiT [Sulfolobales archaeon]MCG2894388.1 precorrin-6Y C5,15-methyltransferase (decarboxylating) subunit CbiT [Sulfolobales archaeon]MCG2911081.1 precorrin-6Y C5,15-methyltransferase (decarboxylating) subunit CbiT [Sulfolobales archaeon]